MEFFEVINKRYSHKEEFLPDTVPLEKLELIARAGLAAPTGTNSQCVRLIILPDREAIKPLSDLTPVKGLLTAPAAIAVLTDSSTQPDFNNFEKEDYSAAVENMLLAAIALGYVSLWLDSPYFDKEKEKAALKLLGAPENHKLWAVLPIGFPAGPGTRRDKLPLSERLSYKRFGQKTLQE